MKGYGMFVCEDCGTEDGIRTYVIEHVPAYGQAILGDTIPVCGECLEGLQAYGYVLTDARTLLKGITG